MKNLESRLSKLETKKKSNKRTMIFVDMGDILLDAIKDFNKEHNLKLTENEVRTWNKVQVENLEIYCLNTDKKDYINLVENGESDNIKTNYVSYQKKQTEKIKKLEKAADEAINWAKR